MNKRVLLLLAGVVLMAGTLFAIVEIHSQAQSPATPSQSAPPMQSPATQADGAAVDGQGGKRYLVGPGDVLDVRIFGQADLNSTVEIDDEGNISSLPFLEQPIPAMCRNEKEIQKSIAQAYSHYLKNPRVSVRVTERRSRPPAVVFGAVRAPTRIQMMRRVRLHELLVAAGGVTLGASGQIQIVHTEHEMCPQDAMVTPDVADVTSKPLSTSPLEKKTGTDTPVVTTVSDSVKSSSSFTSPGITTSNASDKTDDKSTSVADQDRSVSDIGKIETYEVGDVRTGLGKDDPYIRPGDIVIVTEGEPIYLTGYLNAPREIVMKDNMTLIRAIAMAGGIQRTAKSHEVYVYRQVKGKLGPEKLKFDYDAIKNGKQPDVLLQAYDIIDVRPQSSWSPANLRDMLLGLTRTSMTGMGSSLPYRVLY